MNDAFANPATIAVLVAFVLVLLALARVEDRMAKRGHRRRDW